eukprot:3030390-Amphidinium_carterae.1
MLETFACDARKNLRIFLTSSSGVRTGTRKEGLWSSRLTRKTSRLASSYMACYLRLGYRR